MSEPNGGQIVAGFGCLVLLAAILEIDLGLCAMGRVRQGGGADYWVAAAGTEINSADGELDLEAASRLEVSGIENCHSEAELLHRLAKKVEQVKRGGDDGGLAAVVTFNKLAMCLRVA